MKVKKEIKVFQVKYNVKPPILKKNKALVESEENSEKLKRVIKETNYRKKSLNSQGTSTVTTKVKDTENSVEKVKKYAQNDEEFKRKQRN